MLISILLACCLGISPQVLVATGAKAGEKLLQGGSSAVKIEVAAAWE